MIRVTKMSGRFYATSHNPDKEHHIEEVNVLVNECTPVLLANDIDEACDVLNITPDLITMIKRLD